MNVNHNDDIPEQPEEDFGDTRIIVGGVMLFERFKTLVRQGVIIFKDNTLENLEEFARVSTNIKTIELLGLDLAVVFGYNPSLVDDDFTVCQTLGIVLSDGINEQYLVENGEALSNQLSKSMNRLAKLISENNASKLTAVSDRKHYIKMSSYSYQNYRIPEGVPLHTIINFVDLTSKTGVDVEYSPNYKEGSSTKPNDDEVID